jgi:hypothetical protein
MLYAYDCTCVETKRPSNPGHTLAMLGDVEDIEGILAREHEVIRLMGCLCGKRVDKGK